MTNIVNILRNKTKGTKLYSNICGECSLLSVEDNCIAVETKDGSVYTFNEEGKFELNGEIALFPSNKMKAWGKFSWEKGDILVDIDYNIVIFDHWCDSTYYSFIGKPQFDPNVKTFTTIIYMRRKDVLL